MTFHWVLYLAQFLILSFLFIQLSEVKTQGNCKPMHGFPQSSIILPGDYANSQLGQNGLAMVCDLLLSCYEYKESDSAILAKQTCFVT